MADMVTLTGTFQDAAGTPMSGSILFALCTEATDGQVIYSPAEIRVTLDVDGAFTVDLEATDDLTTSNMTYRVTERFNGEPPNRYWIELPGTVDPANLADLATFESPPFVALDPTLAASNVGLTAHTLTTAEQHVHDIDAYMAARTWFNVRDYGAVGDANGELFTGTDDTAAIQDAIDAAGVSGGTVYLPHGAYRVTQLELPRNVLLRGEGWHGFGTSWTRLQHIGAVNQDMIVFTEDENGYIGPVGISDLQLWGSTDSTSGHGINTALADGSIAKAQDACTFERLFIYGFAGDGIRVNGGAPFRATDIATLMNSGYGINIVDDGTNTPYGNVLHCDLTNISGDGNSGGAAVRVQGLPDFGVVNVVGLKSEQRNNTLDSTTSAQQRALILQDCEGVVNVTGCSHISSGSTTVKPGPVIWVSGSVRPAHLSWSGVNVRVLAAQVSNAPVGPPLIIDDNVTDGQDVPLGVAYGTLGASNVQYHLGIDGAESEWHFGTDPQPAPAPANPAVQVEGPVPMLAWWETDAAADSKGWAMGPSGGGLVLRTLDDSGNSGQVFVTFDRSGTTFSRLTLAGQLAVTDFAQLSEIAEPGVASADTARLFAKDNGSGKTQLCVRFPSGATQVLATEA